MILHADCLTAMAEMPAESVDAIVTDPPYGLEFMGKEWDRLDRGQNKVAAAYTASGRHGGGTDPFTMHMSAYKGGPPAQQFHAAWAEAAYRVAKPSAYLLAFGGTRTVHRMTVALEDAGWIIRDMLVWAYASGFPKSKASLKPAWEPIVMARKPGPLRELAIDVCRIEAEPYSYPNGPKGNVDPTSYGPRYGIREGLVESHPAGRWPANVILTDPIFDGGIEGVVGGGVAVTHPGTMRNDAAGNNWFGPDRIAGTVLSDGDSGTYSRFFLISKADRAEREPVPGMLPTRDVDARMGLVHGGPGEIGKGSKEGYEYRPAPRRNVHPTVKPVDLMRHLVRLVTPTGGTVLDPFLGSGTTGIACEMEGFDWIGIEKEAEYVAIAEARMEGVQRGFGLEGIG